LAIVVEADCPHWPPTATHISSKDDSITTCTQDCLDQWEENCKLNVPGQKLDILKLGESPCTQHLRNIPQAH
jgi:hypothetical protein